MLPNAAKYQGYSFYRFWVIKGKPTGGKITPPPPSSKQISVKNIFFTEHLWASAFVDALQFSEHYFNASDLCYLPWGS